MCSFVQSLSCCAGVRHLNVLNYLGHIHEPGKEVRQLMTAILDPQQLSIMCITYTYPTFLRILNLHDNNVQCCLTLVA